MNNPANVTSVNSVTSKAQSRDMVRKKKSSALSASISYCRHCNVKIVIGTEFSNSPELNEIKREHPAFGLHPLQLVSLFSKAKTPTEKYISAVALLVKLKLIDTTDCGLILEQKESYKVEKQLAGMLTTISNWLNQKIKVSLPTLKISEDNNTKGSNIVEFLKEVNSTLESKCGVFASLTKKVNETKLDDEIELERDIRRILETYHLSNKNKKYNPKLGKWAVKELKANTTFTSEQESLLLHYLNTDKVERLHTDILRKLINFCKNNLSYEEHNRTQSLLVIRHLEARLEHINKVSESLGFIILQEEESKNTKGQMTYKTKTKVKEVMSVRKVVNRKPTGETALDRLKAKFGSNK